MKVFTEYAPSKGAWAVWPTLLYFERGKLIADETTGSDLTLMWLCFGVTLRWGEDV